MDDTTRNRIKTTIEDNRIVLFMKGTKNFPQCGFSHRVVEILKSHGAAFADVNVLTDAAVRDGIKEYSSWPTIPQLYVDGKFIGGCDIVTELHQNGELEAMLGSKRAS
jgi:monothiol glutaredoxin